MTQVVKNSVVTLDIHLSDSDGNPLDHTEDYVYLHGGHDGIFPLVEEALHGKAVGDCVELTLQPGDAFGEYDPELVQIEPLDRFPVKNVEVGMQFEGSPGDEEDSILYTITQIADGQAVVDGNHPMAGQVLRISATVVAARAATSEELAHGHAHESAHDHQCH